MNSGPYTTQWQAALTAERAAHPDADPSQLVRNVNKANPGLREKMVLECNGKSTELPTPVPAHVRDSLVADWGAAIESEHRASPGISQAEAVRRAAAKNGLLRQSFVLASQPSA